MRYAFLVIAFVIIVCVINWPVWFPSVPKVNADGVSGTFLPSATAIVSAVPLLAPTVSNDLVWSPNGEFGSQLASISTKDGRIRYVIAGKDTDRATFYRWLDRHLLSEDAKRQHYPAQQETP